MAREGSSMGEGKNKHHKKKGQSAPEASEEQAKLTAMLAVLYEHRDELTRMATELPALLRETGQQMHDAGTRAQTASGYLAGDVRELTGHAADMLEASKHQLLTVLHALEKAGGMLKNLPFIGDMGKMMGDQLGAIGDVADNLDQVGQKVRGLGDRLGDVGDDLHLMGASLLGGGAGLGRYGAPAPAKKAAPPRKAPAKKAAPPKKAPAKKAAPPKKAPAKKAAPPKRAPAKKAAPPKRAPAKKAPAKKAPVRRAAPPA